MNRRCMVCALAVIAWAVAPAHAQTLSSLSGGWIFNAPVSMGSLWGGAKAQPEAENCVTIAFGRDGPRQHCNPLAKPTPASAPK